MFTGIVEAMGTVVAEAADAGGQAALQHRRRRPWPPACGWATRWR